MLIIEPKRNQKIKLQDSVSGTEIVVKTFLRENGNIALAFDAPKTVRITREKIKKNENT
jgi:sRNA-binding carbon storage regulator CsrA